MSKLFGRPRRLFELFDEHNIGDREFDALIQSGLLSDLLVVANGQVSEIDRVAIRKAYGFPQKTDGQCCRTQKNSSTMIFLAWPTQK